MSNGTTLCPHCETRFKVAEQQLAAHQGMVRCGHCLQAFDARPNFIPEQPSPQLDLPIDEVTAHAEILPVAEQAESQLAFAEEAPVQSTPRVRPTEYIAYPEEIATTEAVSTPEAHDDTLDFSQIAAPDAASMPPEPDEAIQSVATPEPIPQSVAEPEEPIEFEDAPAASPKRHTWLWVSGLSLATLLLLLQSAYFFRVSLAAHIPALKPALVSVCNLLTCSVPLPQNTELVSIESSSLDAEPAHENQITFNALLRNRASYALAFPVLALTLNDNQDKPLARRIFLPREYLPSDQSETTGLSANHEVSIKLRMDTADLRPVGYRLELFYPH